MVRRSAGGESPSPPERQRPAIEAGCEADVLEQLPDGVLVVDQAGRIAYANKQLERLSGYRRNELVGREMEMLVPAKLRPRHRTHRRAYLVDPKPRPMGSVDLDFVLRRKDGSELAVDIALGPIGRRGNRMTAAVVRDGGERRSLEADLKYRALHDPLTDLANRNLFFDRLDQAMLGFFRDRQSVALVMLDVDRFKSINDTFGHIAGDALLRQIAAQLQTGLRSTDTVARIGGDEFAWILPHAADPAAALRKVRMLLRTMPSTYSFEGKLIEVAISAGLALFPDDGEDADALMRSADLALYTAKRQGGGLAVVSQRSRNVDGRRRRRA